MSSALFSSEFCIFYFFKFDLGLFMSSIPLLNMLMLCSILLAIWGIIIISEVLVLLILSFYQCRSVSINWYFSLLWTIISYLFLQVGELYIVLDFFISWFVALFQEIVNFLGHSLVPLRLLCSFGGEAYSRTKLASVSGNVLQGILPRLNRSFLNSGCWEHELFPTLCTLQSVFHLLAPSILSLAFSCLFMCM